MLSRVFGALQHRREELRDREGGFTLVELLVVVIIIGILAAIAIPVFLGIQDSAKDGAVKSDLANAKIALVTALTDGATVADGTAVTTAGTLGSKSWGSYGATVSPDVLSITVVTGATSPADNFCIEGIRKGTGAEEFHLNANGGVENGTC